MNWEDFFASWETKESYAVIMFMIVAFLLGMLVGALLRTPRIRRLRRELEESNQKLEASRRELGAMKDQLDEKQAQTERALFELEEARSKAETLELDKARLYKEVYNVNQEIERLQTANKSYLGSIEDLNDQVLGLKTRNEQLALELEAAAAAPPLPVAEPVIQPTGGEPETLLADGADLIVGETERRMAAFEARLEGLALENRELRGELEALKQQERGLVAPEMTVATPRETTLNFELDADTEPAPEAVARQEKNVLADKVLITDQPKDDLTLITGVGPFIARQLNDAGIFTFDQIAQWEKGQIDAITRKIGYFPGRIEKDDWVGQAARLAAERPVAPAASEHGEDLQIIEGIGPKITLLLNNAGIHTFQELAAADIAQLKAILEAAGEHYRIHDPGTWPTQAQLAAEARWEELKEYQDFLKGGREI